jgi:orotate phosphoribosyltransferase
MAWVEEKEQLTRDVLKLLYENRMIRTFFRDRSEGWTLISGLYSPIYVQLRPLISYPAAFEKVCRAMARLIREECPEITKIVGIAMAGVPLAAGIALAGGIPAAFTRKLENVKSLDALKGAIDSYGEHSMLEGELVPGDRIALLDDLVTKFDSKLIAMEQVRFELEKRRIPDVECKTVLVVLDREQGGAAAAEREGINLLSLIRFKSVGLPLLKDVMDPKEWQILTDYLEDPSRFQDSKLQAELKGMAVKS